MPIIALLGLVFAALATASTNLTGDIPAVGNGIIQFFKVSWRKSIVIATVIAFFVGPWWAFKESLDVAIYLTEFTSAYGCWLGPIASVMVADYWIGKKRNISVKELYNPKGIYHGFSMIGLSSMAIGILGEYVIGFMTNSLKWYIIPFPGVELSWYYGFVISFLVYFVWMQFGHKIRDDASH